MVLGAVFDQQALSRTQLFTRLTTAMGVSLSVRHSNARRPSFNRVYLSRRKGNGVLIAEQQDRCEWTWVMCENVPVNVWCSFILNWEMCVTSITALGYIVPVGKVVPSLSNVFRGFQRSCFFFKFHKYTMYMLFKHIYSNYAEVEVKAVTISDIETVCIKAV